MSNVIEVKNISKEYRLGTISTGMFTKDIASAWARFRGKEDPNSQVTSSSNLYDANSSERMLALKDINLEIKQGETLGIIGKNGAGKSTLLKILSRITSPTKGEVRIRGRVGSLLEVGTGFHQELTGRENVYLNGAIHGLTKKQIDARFNEIVDFSGIKKYIDTPVKRYSSGMIIRLGFAIAAYLDPDILIVDEILAVGDAEFREKALGSMKYAGNKYKRTTLFVSHNMSNIRYLCTKCILLENGHIIYSGDPEDAIQKYLSRVLSEPSDSFSIDIPNPKKDFQLISACTMSKSNLKKNQFNCDEEIVIHMEFENRKKIPGIYGYLSVQKEEGIVVMTSISDDMKSDPLQLLPLGMSKMKVTIPARILGSGKYHVTINFGSDLNINGFNVDSPGIIATFTLNDPNTNRGDHRAGFTSTILKWEPIS